MGHQEFMPLHCLHSRGFIAIVYDFLPVAEEEGKEYSGMQKGVRVTPVLRNIAFRSTLVAILSV